MTNGNNKFVLIGFLLTFFAMEKFFFSLAAAFCQTRNFQSCLQVNYSKCHRHVWFDSIFVPFLLSHLLPLFPSSSSFPFPSFLFPPSHTHTHTHASALAQQQQQKHQHRQQQQQQPEHDVSE